MIRQSFPHPRRAGSVLILVLWIVIVLGIVGLAYTASVSTQLQTSRAERGRHQAQWAARAGVERAIAELAQADLKSMTDASPLLDDDDNFKDQPVDQASYTLLGLPDEEGNPRYGLVDECSRININRASETILMNINGMTPEMAECLIDWRDTDSEALPDGAETDTYEALPAPYPAKNNAFDSVRELLRVKGWGPIFDLAWPDPYRKYASGGVIPPSMGSGAQTGGASGTNIVDGTDANAATDASAGGAPNAQENPAAANPVTNPGEELDQPGAMNLLNGLTAWSACPATNPDGTAQVNITEADVNTLRQGISGLTQQEAEAIYAWQKNKGFRNVADLVNVTEPTDDERSKAGLSSQNGGGGSSGGNSGSGGNSNGGLISTSRNQNAQSAFTLRRVGEIIDSCSIKNADQSGSAQVQTGRVNINTAPRNVLLVVPGMSEDLADEIIAQRDGGRGPSPNPAISPS